MQQYLSLLGALTITLLLSCHCSSGELPSYSPAQTASGAVAGRAEVNGNPASRFTNGLVVLDPGHGGTLTVNGSSPNNATGSKGTKEKDVTLQVARVTQTELQRLGYAVILTRTNDTNLGLRDRAEAARVRQATAFVSIHFNGFINSSTQGTEVWVANQSSEPSKRLAAWLQQRLLTATRYSNRGVKKADYGVLLPARHASDTAACLAEISFLTHVPEEVRLKQRDYMTKVGQAIANAVADFTRRKTRGPTPEPLAATPYDLENQ